MKEIVSIQIGACGNSLGGQFWESIRKEHGLEKLGAFQAASSEQLEKITTYFDETSNGFVPRAILTDLSSDPLASISFKNLFKRENIIICPGESYGCWPRGHYEDGADSIEKVLEVARKEAEKCESLQGFQFCHSLGGGTGSGMGTLLLCKLKEEYPDKISQVFAVFSTSKVSDIVLEPYNHVLAMHMLIENAELAVALDNEKALDLCRENLNIASPTYADLNYCISNAMVASTYPLRFPSKLTGDLRRYTMHLAPFAREHFLITSYAPIISASPLFTSPTETISQVLNKRNFLSSSCATHGKYLSASLFYKGKDPANEVSEYLKFYRKKNLESFPTWFPEEFPSQSIEKDSTENPMILIANHTSFSEVLQKLLTEFNKLFKRKAFLYRYCQSIDEMELTEAESNVSELITSYQNFDSNIFF